MKKLWEKMRSFLMQCSHAARSRWQKWPKRKRVTVCTLSALAVLIAGAAIFCLTVPLFYWWPNEIYIPNSAGMKAYFSAIDNDERVQERDMGKSAYVSYLNYLGTDKFTDYSCPFAFACIKVNSVRNLNVFQPYQAHHSELRTLPEMLRGTEYPDQHDAVWTRDCIIDATVTYAFYDPFEDLLKENQRVQIYVCGSGKAADESVLRVGGHYFVWMQRTDLMFYNTPDEYYTEFYSVIADFHIESPNHIRPIGNEIPDEETIYDLIEYCLGILKYQFTYAKLAWEEYWHGIN